MGTWTDDDHERAADLLWEAVERTRESHRWLLDDPDPTHDQFYRLGGALTALAHATAGLAEALAVQIRGYPGRHVLRDDAGGNPAHRIHDAAVRLNQMASDLGQATNNAAAYHSAIGHIAVQEGENGEPLRRH